jgi:hypothetical protein
VPATGVNTIANPNSAAANLFIEIEILMSFLLFSCHHALSWGVRRADAPNFSIAPTGKEPGKHELNVGEKYLPPDYTNPISSL